MCELLHPVGKLHSCMKGGRGGCREQQRNRCKMGADISLILIKSFVGKGSLGKATCVFHDTCSSMWVGIYHDSTLEGQDLYFSFVVDGFITENKK